MAGLKVFLAAPFFCEAEREFNIKVAEFLRDNGFEVWMAQENPFISDGSEEEKRRIFEMDLSALKGCDAVVAVLDGECIDSGTAFELGYAYAMGKPIIGIKTDYRTFSSIEGLNLMIEVAVRLIKASTFEELKGRLLEALRDVKP
ncbi:nucleoside 2-deoxyribosyltransferase [Archaeoglobus veneficus]|uniref:Nucleoside 2-deoxyribosyltransferase n=1 Tax=Archaeoglobus veneficus (strain DSM 11195 / SNP6) TaxID=693661 RepID=F2KPY9_ARCVS|nr:nucleoside 2-deoxyribosyltransferase [Archaeoglobus veneficus]AEA46496.1 nucleoside 2-deoxyribosyltransferase [Archaeoglobus veneficus SNP6]